MLGRLLSGPPREGWIRRPGGSILIDSFGEEAAMQAMRAGRAFDGERALPGGALVVFDGERITAVEPGDAPAPAGCEVVDVPGGTVLPGLIDMHVHLCGDGGPGALDRLPGYTDEAMRAVVEESLHVQLAAGVTTVRDLGDRRYAVLDWRSQVAGAADGAGPWPRVIASGPPITSVGGHCWNMGGEASGVEAVRSAVRERAEHGTDLVKIMVSGGFSTPGTEVMRCQFTVPEVSACVREAHAAGLPVTAHAHGLPAVVMAMDAGVDGIEHCSFLTERGSVASQQDVARLVAEGTVVCPTLGLRGSLEPPPAIRAVFERLGLTPEDAFLERGRFVAGLHAAGVRIVSGSDGGIHPAKPHGLSAASLGQLVDGGIDHTAALASATSVAADALGLGSCTGRLRAGLDADILVVDGDPLADITALESVATVWARGRPAS